jgi:hypothetical protein
MAAVHGGFQSHVAILLQEVFTLLLQQVYLSTKLLQLLLLYNGVPDCEAK